MVIVWLKEIIVRNMQEKRATKKVFAKITPKQYEDFTKATEKNCTTKNAVLKQFIIDYIDKNK